MQFLSSRGKSEGSILQRQTFDRMWCQRIENHHKWYKNQVFYTVSYTKLSIVKVNHLTVRVFYAS